MIQPHASHPHAANVLFSSHTRARPIRGSFLLVCQFDNSAHGKERRDGQRVLVQREMERGRSPLLSIPPYGRGFSPNGMGTLTAEPPARGAKSGGAAP